MRKTILIRKRFFLAVEGDNEQSIVKWYQMLCDKVQLNLHLDCEPLGGGGYEKLLNETLRLQKKNERKTAEQSILIVDEDRAIKKDDPWSIDKLKDEARKRNIMVCVQHPNAEGFFLRLFPGKENLTPSPQQVNRLLKKEWPDYDKSSINAEMIARKFTLQDLLKLSRFDSDLNDLLLILKLKK